MVLPEPVDGLGQSLPAQLFVVPEWRQQPLVVSRTIDRRLLLMIGGIGALALAATALIARRVVRPIEQLQAAVQRLSRGALGEQVTAVSGDEVGALAAAFNTMSAQLARDDTMRRNMVNDVAHELRTPLTRMLCAVEAVQDGLRRADAGTLTALHDDLTLLQRLVEDLETLALAESGKLPLHLQALDVADEVGRWVHGAAGRRSRTDRPGDPSRSAHCGRPHSLSADHCEPGAQRPPARRTCDTRAHCSGAERATVSSSACRTTVPGSTRRTSRTSSTASIGGCGARPWHRRLRPRPRYRQESGGAAGGLRRRRESAVRRHDLPRAIRRIRRGSRRSRATPPLIPAISRSLPDSDNRTTCRCTFVTRSAASSAVPPLRRRWCCQSLSVSAATPLCAGS